MGNVPRCVAAALIASAIPAAALERPVPVLIPITAETGDPGDASDWSVASTCEVVYYNRCVNWLVGYHPTLHGDTFGVVFDGCATNAVLDGVWIFSPAGEPAGWGYTGYISAHEVDVNDAPVRPAIEQRPFLSDNQWTFYDFDATVPDRFVVTVEYHGGISGDALVSDYFACAHPAPPHSFYYGTAMEPLSPGSPLATGFGTYNEFLWRAAVRSPTTATPTSWSAIKRLYR
jgi:hypothetical protein